MYSSVLSASSMELIYITSAVLVGTAIATLFVSLVKRVFKKPVHSQWIHGYLVQQPRYQGQRLDGSTLLFHWFTEIGRRTPPSPDSVRGYLSSLPSLQPCTGKPTLEMGEGNAKVYNFLILTQKRHPRSTYLGVSSDRNCILPLYAQQRVNGSIRCLGEIASLNWSTWEDELSVSLHPKDAEQLITKGWARRPQKTLYTKLIELLRSRNKDLVLMNMPGSRMEMDQVIVPAIEAAVSWALELAGTLPEVESEAMYSS